MLPSVLFFLLIFVNVAAQDHGANKVAAKGKGCRSCAAVLCAANTRCVCGKCIPIDEIGPNCTMNHCPKGYQCLGKLCVARPGTVACGKVRCPAKKGCGNASCNCCGICAQHICDPLPPTHGEDDERQLDREPTVPCGNTRCPASQGCGNPSCSCCGICTQQLCDDGNNDGGNDDDGNNDRQLVEETVPCGNTRCPVSLGCGNPSCSCCGICTQQLCTENDEDENEDDNGQEGGGRQLLDLYRPTVPCGNTRCPVSQGCGNPSCSCCGICTQQICHGGGATVPCGNTRCPVSQGCGNPSCSCCGICTQQICQSPSTHFCPPGEEYDSVTRRCVPVTCQSLRACPFGRCRPRPVQCFRAPCRQFVCVRY